jgi:RimJ/RimL family protein N-acetyltransferase
MEKMLYRAELDMQTFEAPAAPGVTSDWRRQLPVLAGRQVRLRELRASDAPSLFALLTTEEVARFISPPPTTVEGFERFIAWTLRQRAGGTYACFAVTIAGQDTAIGIFQVRETEPGFATELVLRFVFETLGVHRLEARAALRNGRGNGALRKVGAVQEGVLRKSFLRHGEYVDQALYAIVDEDWQAARSMSRPQSVVVH